ncbi:MAG: hypothetical protein FXF54_07435 [Kosmotoga sp.]|nr:MAG: hypothetical protein FXF54_07435 [Kosmotoga sp.]
MIKKVFLHCLSIIIIVSLASTSLALTVNAPGFDLGVLSIEDPTEFNNQTFWIEIIKEMPISIIADYEMYAKTATGELILMEKFLQLFLISITHYIEMGESWVPEFDEILSPPHKMPDDGYFRLERVGYDRFYFSFRFDPALYQVEGNWCQLYPSKEYVAKVTYTILPDPPTGGGDGYLTYTPGGWGAPPTGGNAGTYLHDNFGSTFTNGIVLGIISSGKFVLFTSAQAITSYLPSGGQPSSLTTSYLDPEPKDLKNELVNQLLAAKLNVGFDLSDPDFAPAIGNLLNLELNWDISPLNGFTVAEIISIADAVLSGIDLNYSTSEVTDALAKINENFVDGGDLGYLY